jgi:ATP-dependent DNA ligase
MSSSARPAPASRSSRRACTRPAKATLASVLAKAAAGLRLNEHIEADEATVFAHAFKMGLEGIVSKRKNSSYCWGPSRDWPKTKNPGCTAVKREAGD